MATSPSSITADEALEAVLNAQPWDEHLARLTVYAAGKIRKLFWRGERSDCAPGGKEAADFALQAVGDVLTRKRRWNPEQAPDLFGYLCDVVDSLTSNAATASENKERRWEADAEENSSALNTPNLVHPRVHENDWEYVQGFLEELNDDRDLRRVVECVVQCGCLKRGEIAEKLDISVEETTKRRTRLRRRFISYQAKINDSSLAPPISGKEVSAVVNEGSRVRPRNQALLKKETNYE